jgi:hypothetical protein
MNVDQIVRLACYQSDAIKKAGTLAPFLTTAELLAWANEGNRKLEKKLRTTGAKYFERRMLSTTATAEKIGGINYTPSTSLPLAVGVNRLTLPPDFQEMKVLRIITSGYENTAIKYLPYDHAEFRSSLNDTTNRNAGCNLYWDIIGERTLVWTPRINTALDIEIDYIARQKRLHSYSTGTVSVSDTATTVTGVGTVWSTGAPFDSAYLDMMFSTGATAPVAEPSLIYDGVMLNRVASITDDTHLELAAAHVGAVAGKAFTLSSVPVVPEDYHYQIANFIEMKIRAKAGDSKASQAVMTWPDDMADMLTTASRRQSQEHETVESWEPWS